jgi:hypothetical protein
LIIQYKNEKERGLLVSASLIAEIHLIAKQHLPNEFGGILTGIRYENYDIVVDFEIPKQFKQSQTNFIRYADSLNDYLKNIFEITEGGDRLLRRVAHASIFKCYV